MAVADLIADLRKKEKIEKYWDFRKDDKREHVHSMIKYPAVMVPNMQGEIFDLILKNDPDIHNVLDPFMGSGTILVEGLVRKLDVIGIDINPLSYLTVIAKTQKYGISTLYEKANLLIQRIDSLVNKKIKPYSFEGIKKWYKPSVIDSLSKIRFCILQESELKYRRLFWVTFADIAKEADNARTSTFKLHIKTQEDIQATNYDCIAKFKEKLSSNIQAVTCGVEAGTAPAASHAGGRPVHHSGQSAGKRPARQPEAAAGAAPGAGDGADAQSRHAGACGGEPLRRHAEKAAGYLALHQARGHRHRAGICRDGSAQI